MLMAGSSALLAGQRGFLMFSLLHHAAALLPFHHQILAAKIWRREEGDKKERKQEGVREEQGKVRESKREREGAREEQ